MVALLGLWAIRRDPSGPTPTIRLIAATDPGPGPFTDDASNTLDADIETIRTIGADLLPQAGDAGPVLRPLAADTGTPAYGTTETLPCDVDAIAASLDAHPDARTAWADLMGIEPSEIPATLATLTPLVLAHDTAVTNSQYLNGTPSTFQAILQAGTAVLVDRSGTPRVKCSCGNPLLPPQVLGDTTLEGDKWDDFDEDAIVTIEATPQDTPTLDTIDATTGGVVSVELADAGGAPEAVKLDGYLVDDANGVYVSDAEGNRTKVLDGPVSAVFDDGRGGLVFQRQRSNSASLWRRRDTGNVPGNVEQASIWHLPAGAAEPVPLVTTDDPERHWFSLQAVRVDADVRQVIFYDIGYPSGCDEFGCSRFGSYRAAVLDLDSDTTALLPKPMGVVGAGLRAAPGSIIESWTVEGDWGRYRIDPSGAVEDLGGPDELWDCACRLDAVLDEERFVALFASESDGASFDVCRFDAASPCRSTVLTTMPLAQDSDTTTSLHGNRLLVSTVNTTATAADVWELDLAVDAEQSRSLPTAGRTAFLRAPLVRPISKPDLEEAAPTEAISGIQRDGLTLDGPLPLRWGASLAEVEQVTGVRGEPICGLDSTDQGAVIGLDGMTLWIEPGSGLWHYGVQGGPWTTPEGIGIGTSFADARERFPRLRPPDPSDAYSVSGFDLSLDGRVPTEMLLSGDDRVEYLSVASEASIWPESGIC